MATEDKKSEIFGIDYQYVAKKVAPTFKIPIGELYTRLESGKGEIGCLLYTSPSPRDTVTSRMPSSA